MIKLAWICLGGALGTGGRHLLSLWTFRVFGPAFPVGTFTVNLIGSFLLAMLMYLSSSTNWFSPTATLALTTGVMGGFTTYSTFSFETLKYFQSGDWRLGLLNIFLTLSGGLLACLGGWFCARWLTGTA